MKKVFAVAGVVLVAVVALGVSTHAAAGAMPHEGLDCLACAACEFIHGLIH